MHLWSPRRNKLNAVKRSMSSPTTALVTSTNTKAPLSQSSPTVEDLEHPIHAEDEEEGGDGDKRSYTDVAKDGISAARDALLGTGSSSGTPFAGKEKEREKEKEKKEEEGWASGLFYAYARRTNLPNSSRYILTFSSARTCLEWWSLVQSEFGGPPSNTRESAQLFSFSGDDMPVRAWKNPRFDRLKTKWFYTQLGDAVGTGGRGLEVLPLQDEKGWAVGVAPVNGVQQESAIQRRASSVESLAEAKGRVLERRRSKRDSGILLMSPFSEHFKNTEEAVKAQSSEEKSKNFDFERMERNLEKVEKLMEQNAQQMRSLEHVQAANLERLTAALMQNAELVQELARGQEGLVHACEELRVVVQEREETDRTNRSIAEKAERERQMMAEKGERERQMMAEEAEKKRKTMAEEAERQRQIMAEKAERERQMVAEKAERERKATVEKEKRERKLMSDKEDRDNRSRSKEAQSQHLTRSQSVMTTATQDTIATLSPCGHVVRRAPRKLGRQVVGYIYANDEHQDIAPVRQERRRTKES